MLWRAQLSKFLTKNLKNPSVQDNRWCSWAGQPTYQQKNVRYGVLLETLRPVLRIQDFANFASLYIPIVMTSFNLWYKCYVKRIRIRNTALNGNEEEKTIIVANCLSFLDSFHSGSCLVLFQFGGKITVVEKCFLRGLNFRPPVLTRPALLYHWAK